MKKVLVLLLICALALSLALPAYAEDGNITYNGDAHEFVFEPGSEESPTDLFPNFKDVMPGDELTQKITIRNNASRNVKVKLYIRSLGVNPDSVEFLSQLSLKVSRSDDNEMGYMFAAAASEPAQLSDWVCLGELYSGGKVHLDVTLLVPKEMGNTFQNKVGRLNWEFKAEEFPIAPDDPEPPVTGDDSRLELWILMMAGSLILMLFILFLLWKKRDRDDT